MSVISLAPTRRELLPNTAAAAALSAFPGALRDVAADASIRPFGVNFPQEQLVDLRRRVAAIRWPDKETVTDDT